MATKAQRVQSLCDAATNRITPLAQQTQLADALAKNRSLDPAALTQAQKLDLVLSATRLWMTGEIKQAENGPVSAAAVTGNSAAIDTAFAEAP